MRKDISLHATLNDCERLTGVEDLLRFGDWLAQRGFRMLVYPQPSQEVTLSGADIASYFAQTGPNGVHDWLQKRRDKYPFSYGRPLLAPGMEELLWHFGVEYDSRVNRMAVGLGGLVDFGSATSGPGRSPMPSGWTNWFACWRPRYSRRWFRWTN